MQYDSKITIEQVVQSAKMQLRINGTSDDSYLRMLAMEAEKEMATRQTLIKKTSSLAITAYKTTLPTGVYQINWIRYENSEDDIKEIKRKEKEWLDKFIDQHLKPKKEPKKDMHSLYIKNKNIWERCW